MNQLPAAIDTTDGPHPDGALEAHAAGNDADEEWLGYEAVHPLTWVPGSTADGATA